MDLGEDELALDGLTLKGVSRGGIQTSLAVPELGVMFDVGGRMPGQLRFGRVLVSHGHQDHLGGLPILASQRHLSGLDPLKAHVPAEIIDPLQRIFAAWAEIEDYALDLELYGHSPGDRVDIGRGLQAVCLRSVHRVPSLAWVVERHSKRLKPEYHGVPGAKLAELRRQGVAVTEAHVAPILCVTGDTQIELFDREALVRQSQVLVYEVTSWDQRRTVEQIRRWGHTHVDEIIERAERFEGDALVLVHRSARHSRAQAERIVQERFPASVREKVHVFGN